MPGGSRRQADEALVEHLAAGHTVESAAQLSSISRATAFRRLKDETFRRRVAEAHAEMHARAMGVLSSGAVEAATRLRVLLQSGDEKVQLAAARAILENATRYRDSVELEERLAALEEVAAKQKERRR
jgi:hypothetical protein